MTGKQAGQSANEIARRHREKIARLQRSAAAWEAGAVGEQTTGRVLATLDPAAWRVLHDVPWPGRPRANIDHIVVGPPGVFVIDSKNWSGSVKVDRGVLRCNGRSRESAVAGVAEAGIAVLELVPDTPVRPVLCLVRDDPADGWVRDVMLCSTGNLLQMITTRPPVLSPDDVRRVTATIHAGLGRRRRADQPGSSSRPVSPRRRSRGRSGPSLARFLTFVLIVAVMWAGLTTGTFTALTEKFSEVFVSQVVDDDPPADGPQERPGKHRKDTGRQQGTRPGS